MKCYSYVVRRDYGFAPNPFGGYCTLATCKPNIRKSALVGDWIIGTGSVEYKAANKMVYVMQISEKLHFNDYWCDKRFAYKKPVLNGSLKQMYGDNIYHYDKEQGIWVQENSHHSNPDGTVNVYNRDRDLQSKYILISNEFWYFGENAVIIPDEFLRIRKKGPGYRSDFSEVFIEKFLIWLKENYEPGYRGNPNYFTHFKRYDGKS